jgi:hypothetical protein
MHRRIFSKQLFCVYYRLRASLPTKKMKVLIQKSGTDLFLSKAGLWLKGRHAAHDHKKTTLASKICMRQAEPGARILLAFPDEKYDIQLNPYTAA